MSFVEASPRDSFLENRFRPRNRLPRKQPSYLNQLLPCLCPCSFLGKRPS